MQAGDVVLQLSSAYNMVKNTLTFLSTFEGIQVVTVPVVFPGKGLPPTGIMNQTLLGAIEAALSSYPHSKLLVISHITSVPAAIFPVEDVARLCQQHGIPTLVDGAHALGHIPVDIGALSAAGVDFWIGNGHKWLYSPKGTAVLWTSKAYQAGVVPTVISSEYGETYLDHFEYTGTRDYSSFCAIGAALDFRKGLGEEEILDWNVKLAHWGEGYLAGLWETEVLLPQEMTGMMSHPRLPAAIQNVKQMQWLAGSLLSDYGIYAVLFNLVNPETSQETFWVRLSAQIYLEQADIITFGNAVLELIPKIPPSLQ
uniref:Aminotransferase class V domain-containing protein n=1 Tax=Arcella intermedia TaxID=1963864 RepID=A0A6B2L9A6_9EUKA